MSLDTYANLKTAVADWMADDDLATQITDFVTLCEAELNRELRVRRMEQRAYTTTVASQDFYAWPTDLLEVRNIFVDGDPDRALIYRTASQMRELDDGTGNSTPSYWSDVQAALQLQPVPTASLTIAIDYYKRLALATDLTNWLLTYHPDVYLFGTLRKAGPYMTEETRLAQWERAYMVALESVKEEDRKFKAQQPVQITTDGPVV